MVPRGRGDQSWRQVRIADRHGSLAWLLRITVPCVPRIGSARSRRCTESVASRAGIRQLIWRLPPRGEYEYDAEGRSSFLNEDFWGTFGADGRRLQLPTQERLRSPR